MYAAHSVGENTHIELKRTYETHNKARAEMAQDIAAMALYGGVIVIGVGEDGAGNAAQVHPVDLGVMADRVHQRGDHPM